jgi:hypothetical protein
MAKKTSTFLGSSAPLIPGVGASGFSAEQHFIQVDGATFEPPSGAA